MKKGIKFETSNNTEATITSQVTARALLIREILPVKRVTMYVGN